jgi:hypothetical protein
VDQKEEKMSHRDAIGILMLSPVYWRLTLEQRKELIKEYCCMFLEVSIAQKAKELS